MSYLDVTSGSVVSELPGEQKAAFIRRTYAHLAAAIAVFALVEAQLLKLGLGEQMLSMLSVSPWTWLIVLGAFMLVGNVANKWAHNGASREMQYAGLGLFIVAEAIIFLPLIYMAMRFSPDVLPNAALITGALVGGLTLVVFTTRKDFSFLAPALTIGGFIAMGIIVASILFGLQIGTFFSAAMIIFAGVSVLYTTSNILHEYREDQHVAASLALFSSVALMFWYVVQFLMSFGSD
ncbi:MAG: FtsH-binding integral membrane protein [Dinoroseobacter sp.]|jgi:FtsH-binding integral membrane protein